MLKRATEDCDQAQPRGNSLQVNSRKVWQYWIMDGKQASNCVAASSLCEILRGPGPGLGLNSFFLSGKERNDNIKNMKSLPFSRSPQIWLAAVAIWILPLIVMGITRLIFDANGMVVGSFDWGICGLCLLGGLLLVFQRKLFWFLAICILFLVAVLNLYHASILAARMQSFDYQFMLSVTVFLSIGLISYYYRFPYLDGRDTGLFGIAHRFTVSMPSKLDELQGSVTSVSVSGVLFVTSTPYDDIQVGDQMELTIAELGLTKVPVEVRGLQGEKIRLKFLWLGFQQFQSLKKQMKSLAKS
jgi:hypothetical protein